MRGLWVYKQNDYFWENPAHHEAMGRAYLHGISRWSLHSTTAIAVPIPRVLCRADESCLILSHRRMQKWPWPYCMALYSYIITADQMGRALKQGNRQARSRRPRARSGVTKEGSWSIRGTIRRAIRVGPSLLALRYCPAIPSVSS